MTPAMEEILARCTLKGWTLDTVLDTTRTDDVIPKCQYCGARIRWAFSCVHQTRDATGKATTIHVGSECVNSFIQEINGKESLTFFRSKWRQRRSYYWKRYQGRVAIVGQHKVRPTWWAAMGDSVLEPGTWRYERPRFRTAEDAQTYLVLAVLRGQAR